MIRVLIVEDEQILRRGLIRQVAWEKCGCVVCGEARNGQEGLQLIASLQPQIVITDVRMPLMDGLEMLRQSKATFGYEAIILSGFGEFEYARSAMALCVADYLLKPVDLKQLEELIARLAAQIPQPSATGPSSSLAHQAAEYIRQHISEELTGTQIAQAMGVSADHLSRLMKRDLSLTLHECLKQLRMDAACQLLQSAPEMKVYEVAEKVGYPDYKYFHTVFTRHVGVSPSEYKRSIHKEKKEE